MKSLRNKVILSGIVLLFAFMATVGSTYAWFTVSQSVSVSEMNLSVSAADNLVILAATNGQDGTFLRQATNYETTITNQMLYDAGQLGEEDVETPGTYNHYQMQPVSVVTKTAGDDYPVPEGKSLYYTTSADPTTYSAAIENSLSGHYIELTFWVLSQAPDVRDFNLSSISITAEDQDGAREEIAEAVRVSMWLDDTTYATTEYPSVATTDAKIFGNDTNYSFDFLEGETGGTLAEYYDAATSTSNGAGYVTDLETAVNDITGFSGLKIDDIQNSLPTLLTVLIYIEGWNSFADNDIAEANFDISFTFSSTDPV
jgi:hypothetical protein